MDIRKIIAMVLRKWPVIVITAFIGAVAMYVFSSVYVTPIYSAKATMIVNKSQYQASEQNQMSYNDILMTQKLVKSYTIIMTSDTNLDLVKKELDTEMSIGAIRRSVKVSSVGETEVLQISVEHADPVLAQNIANALVKVSPATIIRVIKAGSAEVIDYALVPQSPVKPVVWQYGALGALIGLMLALAMIFLRDYFDNTFKTEDDIREVLDLPVITSLPEIMKDGNTVLTGETPFDFKEAFKVLRTKIQFSGIDGQMKKIAITSSGPFEGKTTVSINTALTLAETGKSVLLVDCDLRKPKVSKTLDIGQEPGLSNVLTQDSELELAIRNLEDFDTLDIIPCGVIPPNPAELLGSEQMGKFLDEIDSEYDYIIFDTPPIGLVADTAELSKFLDGVIWVVSYGRTIKESAIFAKETLDSVSANIIGCVFNRVKADGYGTRGYYRRYGYGGRYGYKYGYRRYGYGYGGRYSYRYGYGYGEEDPERAAKRGIFGYFGNGKADDDKKGDD
ncbi:MAG: polysaccharide biosynthesis tyrosine autokinase [Clostridiales bacterium]|nr:polysaccharide biosynthesis tyrosine autokinase [Clostridiales bacterium]